jgi:hypothetical protein
LEKSSFSGARTPDWQENKITVKNRRNKGDKNFIGISVYKNELLSVLPVDSRESMEWIQGPQLTVPCQQQVPSLFSSLTLKENRHFFQNTVRKILFIL